MSESFERQNPNTVPICKDIRQVPAYNTTDTHRNGGFIWHVAVYHAISLEMCQRKAPKWPMWRKVETRTQARTVTDMSEREEDRLPHIDPGSN